MSPCAHRVHGLTDLHTKRLNVVCAIGSPCEVGQVELDLIPTIIQTHRHCAYEGLHTGGRLVVGCSESPTNVLIVQHLNLKGEVLFEIFDDHDKKGKLDAKGLAWVSWTGDEGCAGRKGGRGVGIGGRGCTAAPHLTLVPTISRTSDWMSLSVILFMCPLRTWGGLNS